MFRLKQNIKSIHFIGGHPYQNFKIVLVVYSFKVSTKQVKKIVVNRVHYTGRIFHKTLKFFVNVNLPNDRSSRMYLQFKQ